MLRWTKPEVGDVIVDIVASINAYARKVYDRDPVTANYSGKAATLDSLEKIMEAVNFADREIKDIPGHAGEYMRGMNRSNRALVRRLSRDGITYKEAVRDILQVELREIPVENFDRLSDSIDKQLTAWGYKGAVNEKISAWQQDKKIAPDEVVTTAHQLVKKMRETAVKKVRPMPEGENLESINGVTGVYWSGLSEYLKNFTGRLTFNIERPWNTPSFASVLSHEAYPGHHMFYTHWDNLFQQGLLPLEASFYLIDSPTNCLFEGGPEVAINFIGWNDFSEQTPEISDEFKKEISVAKDIMDLQRMLQTNACYKYNVEGLTKEEVLHYMQKDGWYSELEANNTYNYFSHEYSGLYYPCYYYGRWIVQQAYDLFAKDKKEDFFKILYDTPHTNDTFIKAIENATGASFAPFAKI